MDHSWMAAKLILQDGDCGHVDEQDVPECREIIILKKPREDEKSAIKISAG